MCLSKNQKTLFSFPVIVRNGNYEIISYCESLMKVYDKYRFAHGGSKEIHYTAFHRALTTGKFLKKAQIFLEYDFHSVLRIAPQYEKKMIRESMRLLKTRRIFTGRVRVLDLKTEEQIGIFISIKAAAEHCGIPKSTLQRYLHLDDPENNPRDILIERECRSFLEGGCLYYYRKAYDV